MGLAARRIRVRVGKPILVYEIVGSNSCEVRYLTTQGVRAVLSIVTVSVVVLVAAFLAIAGVLTDNPPDKYIDQLKTYTGATSGILGMILGYYFAKRDE
jgi:hypothetical protein